MSGALLQALGRAIDAGGLPEPVRIVWHDEEIHVRVPPGGVERWAAYFQRHPVRITGRDERGHVAHAQVIAHLVGALLRIDEDLPSG